jgi:DNA-3-methyladenine glycosylase
MMIIPRSFYRREDVVIIAQELLGKMLFSQFDTVLTVGIIVETEAYAGVTDRASHAFGNRRTARTEVMYSEGGTASIKPVIGIDTMLRRSGKSFMDKSFGTGPGRLSKIMGIHFSHSGMDLTKQPSGLTGQGIWLEDEGRTVLPENIITGTRIGVKYAGRDALRLYRFRIVI